MFYISDYFLGECYDVCKRRLEVLIESNMDIPAYNLTSYLVQNVFEDYQNKQPKFSYLHHEWLDKDMDKAHNILDIHIAILYRRKEDTSQLQYLVCNSTILMTICTLLSTFFHIVQDISRILYKDKYSLTSFFFQNHFFSLFSE